MSDSGRETEAKFYVQDLKGIEARLQGLGAHLIQPRIWEQNIRFDLPDASLRSERRVLRLRRDTEARLTYKDPSQNEHGVLSRREIEFIIEDFDKAKQFLDALGYQPVFYYEKYRTIYELNKTLIMLDELPYGNFVEIEGETFELIQEVSDKLNLKWETAIAKSYNALFDQAHKLLNFSFQDLSFANFAGIHVTASHLGVRLADDEFTS